MAMARPMVKPSSPPMALIGTVVLLAIAVCVALAFFLQYSKASEDLAAANKRADTADAARKSLETTVTAFQKKLLPDAVGVKPSMADVENFDEQLERIPNHVLLTAAGTGPAWFKQADGTVGSEAECFRANVDKNAEARALENSRKALTAEQKDIRQFYKDNGSAGQTPVKALEDAADNRMKIYTKLKETEDLAAKSKDEATKAKAERDATQAKFLTLDATYADKLVKVEDAHKTALEAKDADVKAANAARDELTKNLDVLRQTQLTKETEWGQERDRLIAQVKDLNVKLGNSNKAADEAKIATFLSAKSPAGSVSQVFPEMNLVYLNLRRPWQAKLGMRYVVHSKDKPIPDSGEGKAVVEIASLEGGTVQAKIVKSTAGDPITPGDPALNLVVGARKFNFVVYGQFDLRGEGIYEANGKYQIESLIKNWGGNVQQDLDISTNFLVLGDQPQVPTKPAEGADAVTTDNYEQKLAENKKWADLYDKAARQTIPIMNTNTFLRYVGYYNDDHSTGWAKRVRPGNDYLPSGRD